MTYSERERERVKIPILEKLRETYKLWHNFLRDMPKISRYTIGTKIDNLLLEIIQVLLYASYTKKNEKYASLVKASVKLDTLKLFLRLCYETEALENKRYIRISGPVDEIGRMLGGWQKSLEKENSQLNLGE